MAVVLTWHRMSPGAKASPTLTFHSVSVPSVIVGDIAGMLSADVARTTADDDTAKSDRTAVSFRRG